MHQIKQKQIDLKNRKSSDFVQKKHKQNVQNNPQFSLSLFDDNSKQISTKYKKTKNQIISLDVNTIPSNKIQSIEVIDKPMKTKAV